jgi:O-antigen/teichoic acid export membrane protein
VNRLWRSPTLRSVVVYGASGAGFAGANLILARALPTAEYALFTLVVALVNLGYAAGPAGLDFLVTRRGLPAGPLLLRRVLAAATVVSLIFVAVGLLTYHLTPLLLLFVFVSSVTGAAMAVAGARFQSEQRFGLSLSLTQSPNFVLLLAALVVVVIRADRAQVPLLIATLGYAGVAALGWGLLAREPGFGRERKEELVWSEALSLAGMDASGLLLVQLDRLLIARLLSLGELATYGVLAAIVGSLFRVLQMGVGYTLIPRLRIAGSVAERRSLIRREVRLVLALVVGGTLAIWIVTPLVERWLLSGKYHLSVPLMIAALASGIAKVLNAFAKALVTALSEPREVTTVNVFGWISVGVAVAAAAVGARWGLPGVIYGVGLGWLLRAVIGIGISARRLRSAAPLVVPAP